MQKMLIYDDFNGGEGKGGEGGGGREGAYYLPVDGE